MEKRSEAFAAFESVPDALLVVDLDGLVAFAKQQC